MYSTAHVAAGLIIGKITGDYPTAIIGATAADFDHLIPFVKNKVLFSFKKIWHATTNDGDSSRNYLHSIFSWALISGVIMLFNLQVGLIFSIAYLSHFILDLLDNTDFWPFYPWKKINIKGFVGYFSKREFLFTVALVLVYLFI